MKSVLDTFGGDDVDLKTHNEVCMSSRVDKVKTKCSMLVTMVKTGEFEAHDDFGSVERMHLTVRGQVRSMQLVVQARTLILLRPGTILVPGLVPHSGWSVRRDQPRIGVRQAAFERSYMRPYSGEITKLGEVAMGRIPHDAEKPRFARIIDGSEAQDENSVLAEKGVSRARCSRRAPRPAVANDRGCI